MSFIDSMVKLVIGKTKEEILAEEAKLREFWARASTPEIVDKIEEIVAEQHDLKREEIHDDLDFFKDLDDSLDLVEIVMCCEEIFKIELPTEDVALQNIDTVRDLKIYVLSKFGRTL